MNWNLYFFVKLDDIRAMLQTDMLFALFLGATLIAGVSVIYFTNLSDSNEKEKFRAMYGKYYRNSIISCVVFLIIFTFGNIVSYFLPSTGQMAAIYFGDAALKSETSEIVQRMPPKLAKILNNKLDEWISESEPIEIIEEVKKEK